MFVQKQPAEILLSRAPALDELRNWFPHVQESEWLRLKALEAHAKRSKIATEEKISSNSRDGFQFKSARGLADSSVIAGEISPFGLTAEVRVAPSSVPVHPVLHPEVPVHPVQHPKVPVRPVLLGSQEELKRQGLHSGQFVVPVQRQPFAESLLQKARNQDLNAFTASLVSAVDFPYPSPICGTSRWIDDLREVARSSCEGNTDRAEGKFWDLEDKDILPFLAQVSKINMMGATDNNTLPQRFFDRKLFPKSPRFSHVRRSLASVNAARSFQYGAKFFGNAKRYTDELKVVEKMESNEDRRKFRFGLKSVVDFLIQIDFETLLECLTKTDDKTKNNIPGYNSGLVSDGSFNDLMKKSNQKNHTHVAEILRRIKSNLNFTQSLSQYFAMDDMLEPVTCVISDGIRRGPDLGASLRGGTVASNAQVYRHLAADGDHDNRFAVRKDENQNHGTRHFGKSDSRRNFSQYKKRGGW